MDLDLVTILIGCGLVLTGAVFFGYPIGKRIGKREYAETCESHLTYEPCQPRRSSDILSAEFIEEVKR